MKIPNSASRGAATFNMTPMIDVVFLLIIFFLVSSHLAKQDALELDLPTADSAEPQIESEIKRLTINVLDDGTLSIGGASLQAEQLDKFIRTAVAESDSNLEVRIRGSRAAPYGNVEPIMFACAKAGVWNVTYAVYRKEEVR